MPLENAGLADRNVTNVALECPHCEVLCHHQKLEHTWGDKAAASDVVHLILRCINCHRDTYLLILAEESFHEGYITHIQHQYPLRSMSIHPAVPKAVKEAAIEAEKCLSACAFNACGVMMRRAIHALCMEKGAVGSDLYKQLAALKDNHAITPDLRDWADDLRILGRNGAHPEWIEVSSEDAEYGIEFLREILRYVYVLPHERAAKRIKESSKKVNEAG